MRAASVLGEYPADPPAEKGGPPPARADASGVIWKACRSPQGRVGLAIAGIVVVLATLGPVVAPHSPTAFVGRPLSGPTSQALLGTDVLGRDVLSRFLWGGYTILALAIAATLIGVGGGMVLGVVAGYSRSRLDDAIMRPLDIVLAFPQLILGLLFLSILGPKLWLIVLTVGLVHLPQVARVCRAATVAVRERDFVRSAEALGVPRRTIIRVDLIPNISGPLLVEVGLRMTYSVGLIASLSFLGLGRQPPAPDWGVMINENRVGVLTQPWGVVVPVAAIALLTVGVNLVTDSIAQISSGLGRSEA